MSWCWFDLLDEPSSSATAQAAAFEADGRPAGWLAAWRRRARPTRGARRVDDRIVDPTARRHGSPGPRAARVCDWRSTTSPSSTRAVGS